MKMLRNRKNRKKVSVTVRIDSGVMRYIIHQAKKERITPSYFITVLIEEGAREVKKAIEQEDAQSRWRNI